MYNKKEWVNDEIITKEALNNIENGIADLDDRMNDVATKDELQAIENGIADLDVRMNNAATKKELQAIENDIAENNNELIDLKEGLVASLVALGHKVDMNSDWKDLFEVLLTGSGSVPNVPNPDIPSGDGVYLVKDGVPQHNTVFAKACLPTQWTASNSTLHFTLGKSTSGGSHTWFSYDGYVNFNHYDKIEITLRTEKSTQRPALIVARTLSSGTYGYMAYAGYEYEELTTEIVMTTTTMTKYTFNIDDMVGNRTSNARNGYLLIHMNGGDSTESGEIYIQDIVVYPKGSGNKEPVEPTGGMVLFDGGFNTTNSDFGKLALPAEHVYESGGCITAELKNNVCTWGAFCSPNQVNFNNYDAVAITIYTENKQQTNTQLMVARGSQTAFMIGTGNNDVTTVMYDEVAFKNLENTTTPQTYVFNFADLRKQDNDMGYLGFRVKRGDGDGKVYISKIVVYPEGTYYTESIDE